MYNSSHTFCSFPSVVLTFQPSKPQITHAFKRFSRAKLINNSLRTSWVYPLNETLSNYFVLQVI
jgi:hypothetical protein